MGRLSAAALQAALFALIARTFGISEFGTFIVALTATMGFFSIADLGTNTIILSSGSGEEGLRRIASIFAYKAALLLAVSSVAAFACLSKVWDQAWLVSLGMLFAAGEAANDLAISTFMARRRVSTSSGLLVVRRLLALLPFITGMSTHSATAAVLLCYVSGLGVALLAARGNMSRGCSVRAVVQSERRLVSVNTARNSNMFDTTVVAIAAGAATAGLYGAASRLNNPLSLAATSVAQVATPEFGIRDRAEGHRLFRLLLIGFAGYAGVLLCLAPLSPLIIVLLYGDSFRGAAPILAGVFVACAVSGFAQLYSSWYYARGVPRRVALSAWPIAGIGLTAMAVLAHFLGPTGCGVALVFWRVLVLLSLILSWRDEE